MMRNIFSRNVGIFGLIQNIQKRRVAFDCKKVSEEILKISKRELEKLIIKPKVSIILPLNSNGQPDLASKLYLIRKMEMLEKLGVAVEVKHIDRKTSKEEAQELVRSLNDDPTNNGIFVQLPFASEGGFQFTPDDIIELISPLKDLDGLTSDSMGKLGISNDGLVPATPLGICTLLAYYGVRTRGCRVTIVGKGELVGRPLANMLMTYPFYARITLLDVFSENVESNLKQADIVVSASGTPNLIRKSALQQGVILVDCGIHRNRERTLEPQQSARKIIGDIHPECYELARMYTPVPGGVGLLTVGSLGFNVTKACQLQRGIKNTSNLIDELKKKENLDQFLVNFNIQNPKSKNIVLISSAYNGMTQMIEKTIKTLGHRASIKVVDPKEKEEQLTESVMCLQPDLIICPFLKTKLPAELYKKIKCLIVHPGIKGDRGACSLDWAILNSVPEWGVTVFEATEVMDSGDIWATASLPVPLGCTKSALYNSLVVPTAAQLVKDIVVNKLDDATFRPEPLDYSNEAVKGRLMPNIKRKDPERNIDWDNDDTETVIRKARAADGSPGIKADLCIGKEKFTRLLFGIHREAYLRPFHAETTYGEIFARRNDAICVRTKDGAVWVSCTRRFKTEENPRPLKLPAVVDLEEFHIRNLIPEYTIDPLAPPDPDTLQEISLEIVEDKKDSFKYGILRFDFYNGAMDMHKCMRLADALQRLNNNSCVHHLDALILAGSESNWSNGIHLNVVENSKNPAMTAWANILAINSVVRRIFALSKTLLTVSAMQANAGAGGVYMGLATSYTFARPGCVLNPHYKKIGLYGSEYHTVFGAERVGKRMLEHIKESCEPILVDEAVRIGLIDDLERHLHKKTIAVASAQIGFLDKVKLFVASFDKNEIKKHLMQRNEVYKAMDRAKSMERCEREELEEMYQDFFFDRNGFNAKRSAFVHKNSETSSNSTTLKTSAT